MKRFISIVVCFTLLCLNLSISVKSEGYAVGYSDWSEEKTGEEGEVEAVQYGRKVPIKWSNWSTEKIDSLYQVEREGETKHYAYDGESYSWTNANAKELFTLDFKKPSKVTWIYIDVDTYVSDSYTNYVGPPMQAYCDGKLIASVGEHDHLKNWNPDINSTCRYLSVNMSNSDGAGRNRTMIVGSWATTTQKEYSHVIKWSNGQDWRFDKKYIDKYGEESQIPVERLVYSHPIKYTITYNLDGGTPLEDLPTTYTINDEIIFPAVYKKGYEFTGFFDQRGRKVEKINKGSHQNYYLIAKYERKEPTIYVSLKYFEKSDEKISIEEFLRQVNASAKDELDGDISKNIKVDSIKYLSTNKYVDLPSSVDLSVGQAFEVSFSVVNSGRKKAKVTKTFYVLESHEIKDFVKDDIKIYTRYISNDYLDTLDVNSIWHSEGYQELLNDVLTH